VSKGTSNLIRHIENAKKVRWITLWELCFHCRRGSDTFLYVLARFILYTVWSECCRLRQQIRH
jgi:hypothetical protein